MHVINTVLRIRQRVIYRHGIKLLSAQADGTLKFDKNLSSLLVMIAYLACQSSIIYTDTIQNVISQQCLAQQSSFFDWEATLGDNY